MQTLIWKNYQFPTLNLFLVIKKQLIFKESSNFLTQALYIIDMYIMIMYT